jgi:vacuolar-type H+-ATPase subunit I/STV1
MIVPVKKASIAILKENYDDVIKSLQRSSVIMIIDGEAHDRKTSLDLSQSLMADVEQSIKLLKKYEQKKNLTKKRPYVIIKL